MEGYVTRRGPHAAQHTRVIITTIMTRISEPTYTNDLSPAHPTGMRCSVGIDIAIHLGPVLRGGLTA